MRDAIPNALLGHARKAEADALRAETAEPPRPAEAAALYLVASIIWQHLGRHYGPSAYNRESSAMGAYFSASVARRKTEAKAEALFAQAAAESDQAELF